MAIKFAANLSMLYAEVDFLDRFERAALAGFSSVEFLFPYYFDLSEIKARLDAWGLNLALFNLHPGPNNIDGWYSPTGDWGTLGNPGQRDFFRRSLHRAREIARLLKCKRLHLMFGQVVREVDLAVQVECAIDNIYWALSQFDDKDVILLVEPLNNIQFANFALNTTRQALEIVNQINHPNLKLQYDVYHAQMMGGNLITTIRENLHQIGHLQIADVPGRHQPGSGEINYPAIFRALDDLQYSGYVGLEYIPEGSTDESLEWLPREKRG